MNLNKASLASDKVANLYRAAFCLASGNQDLSIKFLESSPKINIKQNINKPLNKKMRLYWAEKILDQYHQALIS